MKILIVVLIAVVVFGAVYAGGRVIRSFRTTLAGRQERVEAMR